MRARVQSGELRVEGRSIPYALHRIAGRKHVHLVIGDAGELQVRAPWRFRPAGAKSLIRDHLDWVTQALCDARARQQRRVHLVSGAWLPLFDERLRLEVTRDAQLTLFGPACRLENRVRGDPRERARRVGGTLRVHLRSLGADRVRTLLESWYRREAARQLPVRVACAANTLGVRPSKITIRGQRTRWGSCSERGTVSLNWRLLLVPSELADYIVVHELCHLRHMDHSPDFWAMVAGCIPDFAARRQRLNALQGSLAL